MLQVFPGRSRNKQCCSTFFSFFFYLWRQIRRPPFLCFPSPRPRVRRISPVPFSPKEFFFFFSARLGDTSILYRHHPFFRRRKSSRSGESSRERSPFFSSPGFALFPFVRAGTQRQYCFSFPLVSRRTPQGRELFSATPLFFFFSFFRYPPLFMRHLTAATEAGWLLGTYSSSESYPSRQRRRTDDHGLAPFPPEISCSPFLRLRRHENPPSTLAHGQ